MHILKRKSIKFPNSNIWFIQTLTPKRGTEEVLTRKKVEKNQRAGEGGLAGEAVLEVVGTMVSTLTGTMVSTMTEVY